VSRYGAIVLAGGRSSRMGADKARLPWNGTTLLEWTVARLACGFEEVIMVAGARGDVALPTGSATRVQVVRDTVAFEGPLKALRLGLAAVASDVTFACACDLPLLNVELAVVLCEMAAGHDCVIPLIDRRPQMLHAAYSRRCLPALDTMIARGMRKLQDLVSLLDVRFVTEEEVRRRDPQLLSFLNVNTPQDYARARHLGDKAS